jgi:hypothetical protein
MDLRALVQEFNRLPRTPKIPSGFADNHWQFALQHVPLDPPGDLLHLVNPETRFNHSEGPVEIPHSASVAAQANIVLRLLLKAFIRPIGEKSHDRWMLPYAPWTWGTADKALAKALETRMRSVGVREELCKIDVGHQDTIKLEKEEWVLVLGKMFEMVGPSALCIVCLKGSTKTQKLQLCSGCRKIHYCSLACQKAHWKDHQKECKGPVWAAFSREPGGPGTRPLPVSAAEYYTRTAPNMPEALALARAIGLRLPGPGSNLQSLR